MNKPRIVIRAFTSRRDAASALLLARLLYHENCSTLVASGRDFVRTLKLWKPEVAVINTEGQAKIVKEISPETAVVLVDGEGMRPPQFSTAEYFSRHPEVLDFTDLVLVWGRKTNDVILDLVPGIDRDKLHIIGNPLMDFARFMPENMKYDPKSPSVGVVLRFTSLNDHDNRSTLKNLPNDGNLEFTIAQCRAFVGLIQVVRILLEKTDLNFSLRPHPREQIESYNRHKAQWFGPELAKRVTIDSSLSFAQWAVRHRALLSRTTTSFLDAYVLGIPVINVDRMCDSEDQIRVGKIGAKWLEAGLRPSSQDEVVALLSSPQQVTGKDPSIEQQLVEYCDYDDPRSACYRMSRLIAELARKRNRPHGLRLPGWLIDRIDAVVFSRIMQSNPYHHNMNFRRGYHPVPEQLDSIATAIIEQAESISDDGQKISL